MMLKNTSCLSSCLVKAGANADAIDGAVDAVDDAADVVDVVDAAYAADAASVGDAGDDADDAEKQIRPVILSCLGKGEGCVN